MAVLTCSVLRKPKAGACSATAGRVREVICPPDTHGVFIEQTATVAGVLYVTDASGYTDEAASPTLVAGSDAVTIPQSGSFTYLLGAPTADQQTTRSIFIGSDTNNATFKVQPLGVEVMR